MTQGPVLELRHLQMIGAIAARGRLTDAADDLGLTPSALSHRIREAERRLDVVLFTRLHKRLRLTPAAEHLVEVANRVIPEIVRAEADVRRINRGVEHIVRIGVEAYSAYFWLPGFLSYLRDHVPGIEVQVMAGAGRDPAQALTNRHVDVVIVAGETGRVGTIRTRLFEDELVFVMPPGHRHADRAYVEGPDIVGEAHITYRKTPEPDREFARLFRASEHYPRWASVVELPEAIIELVAAGQGTSVLARWAIQPAVDARRVTTVRIGRAGMKLAWYAAIRKDDAGNGPIAETARHLSEWCAVNGGFSGKEFKA